MKHYIQRSEVEFVVYIVNKDLKLANSCGYNVVNDGRHWSDETVPNPLSCNTHKCQNRNGNKQNVSNVVFSGLKNGIACIFV